MSGRSAKLGRRPPGEAVLLLVLLAIAVLSTVGIALKVTTDSERASAGREWAVARALYSADAGLRWAAAALRDPPAFLARPEFTDPPDPFGSVRLPLPSHRHGDAGPFSGDPSEDGIRVTVARPSFVGRRPDADSASGMYHYVYEVRVRATEDTTVPRYARELVADVEIGPLPEDFDPVGTEAPGAIIPPVPSVDAVGAVFGGAGFRTVITNWKEP